MDFHAVWCTSLPTLKSATDFCKFFCVTEEINLKSDKSKSFPNLQMSIKTLDILMIMTNDIMNNEVLNSLWSSKSRTEDLLVLKSVGNLALNLQTLLRLHCISIQVSALQLALLNTSCYVFCLYLCQYHYGCCFPWRGCGWNSCLRILLRCQLI